MPTSPAHYDSVDLVVWSGTGNSRHVAERLAAAAESLGSDARVHGLSDETERPETGRRLLGLLGPTHGFTAPWPLLKAAATCPDVRGTDAFVLVTRGGTRVAGRNLSGFEGTAAYLPAAILALRGAHIRGAGAVDMPLNWTVIVPAAAPADVTAIVERGDAQADAFARAVLGGGTAFRGIPQLLLGLLILPVSLGYMLIARLLLAKMFFADERCTSCGLCERRCPQGAVRLRGAGRRPYWTFSCQNCMRCMSECPVQAIQGGQSWLLLYIWLISLPVAATVAAVFLGVDGDGSALASGAVRLLVGYVWIVVSVWLSYALLWLGLSVPGVRVLLARSTLTRSYRRYPGPGRRG